MSFVESGDGPEKTSSVGTAETLLIPRCIASDAGGGSHYRRKSPHRFCRSTALATATFGDLSSRSRRARAA